MPNRFDAALSAFEEIHRQDAAVSTWKGQEQPRSMVYHQRLRHWLEQLDPQATEPMRLAAACQHIERWALERSDFEAGPGGYKKWRSRLAQHHAGRATEILGAVGYDETVTGRVRDFLIKKGLQNDPQVQTFEDAICLTFLELDLESFAQKHATDKVITIIAKTWGKMTAQGHQAALNLVSTLSEGSQSLIRRALG